jgi:hypothetical protein
VKFCLHFLHFRPIWIKFDTGDVHKNLSDASFVEIDAV